MIIHIIQTVDEIFTTLIFIPAILLLIKAIYRLKKWGRPMKILFRISTVLVLLFVVRLFLQQFIFTEVNQHRFVDSGFFPLIEALFYR